MFLLGLLVGALFGIVAGVAGIEPALGCKWYSARRNPSAPY